MATHTLRFWTRGESVQIAGILVGEPTGIEFGSLVEFLDVCIESFQAGAFFVDEVGSLAIDPDLYDEVVEAHRRQTGL